GGQVGGGSAGGTPGSSSSHNNYDEPDHSTSSTGAGGAGGNGHKQGAGGKVVVLPTAALACSPACTVDNGSGLPQEQFLKVTVTLDFGLKENGSAKTMTFEQPFACRMVPLSSAARVTRAGYRFAGFWLDDGTCLYGPDYKATMAMSPYVAAYTLHARWEVDSSILSVTSSEDGASTLGVYGNTAITLRDAVQALVDNPLLVGEDGRRRVTFEKLDATNRVVRLASQIEVPAGVRSFEINGLCTLEPGQKGVKIVTDSNAPVFDFKGRPSDAGGVFSLANLNIEGVSVSDNWHGGAIRVQGGAAVAVDACAFTGNIKTDAYNGGAIFVYDNGSSLLVSSSTFSGNKVSHHGGAVYVHGGYALFVNTTFSGNTAGDLGGAILEDGGGEIDLLNCTFAGNTARTGGSIYSANSNAKITAVNCIFADAKAVTASSGEVKTHWCSMNASPATAFTASGNAVTQVVAGVTHVIHPPRGGADADNEDAAEIYHDASYDHILAVGRDGTRVTLAGDAGQANIPFIVDQLAQARTAPTRGAVRLAVGTEPVVVEIDGVLTDANGNPREGAEVDATALVSYSDGIGFSTNLVIRTAEEGVFGLSVPVDGSDGISHNVTSVRVPALGTESIEVTMAPYALKAASVDVIASPDYIELEGDDISIGNVAARSIAAAKSFDARSSGSFTAGSLKGFREINLEQVSVSGGSLKWLGGSGPAAGVAFANLGAMSVGGGVQTSVSSSLSCGAGGTQSFDVGEAENDGLFQLQARCRNPNGGQLQIDVVEGGNVAFNVTPKGTVGPDGTDRRLVWTIPVRKGQTIRLTMYGGSSAFELSSVRGQFIYFGVAE
ncbi:MAG: hypothetical protein IJG13_23340, partial [Kiritimatiellae bacterium]|nr:hypothetical protein [Kiritimatiellia bacterium]